MVYKVCKGGVRSGNTLRGLHTLDAKRYGRHACLIGRSSMTGRDVTKMVNSSTDDAMIAETVQSTDVILSLNKKQRWQLPATMRHMISSGYFGSAAMVSLLERHKLKRRANCISFVSNKGKVTSVKPGQKRYFSFNLDNIDEEQSKREKRRLLAKAKSRMKSTTTKMSRGKNVITAYTMDGADQPVHQDGEDIRRVIQSSKPEYRMEVFYPCPRTCSLAFNPKYTDVQIDVNEDGSQEIKSVKKQGHSNTRHHRKRPPVPVVGKLGHEDVDADLEEMWAEVHRENGHIEEDRQGQHTSHISMYDDLWSQLIDQAEKAKELCSFPVHRPQNKRARNMSEISCNDNQKSHIVHVSESNEHRAKENDGFSKEIKLEGKQYQSYKDMSSFKVIMSDKEISPLELGGKFGHLYSEADCEPRRFVINLTENVKSVFGNPSSASLKTDDVAFTSYLVFTYSGVYDEGFDVYNVTFNSYICDDTLKLHTDQRLTFTQYTIDDIVNQIFGILLETDTQNKISLLPADLHRCNKNNTVGFLDDELDIKVETFYTEHEINNLSQKELSSFTTKMTQLILDEEFEQFCQICYESVTPSQADSVIGTSLNKCGHVFCDDCWRHHIRTQNENGATEISCPGYECDVTVGPVTLLSLVHATEVGLLLQRQKARQVETSIDTKWCPNPSCGRAIKMEMKRTNEDMSYDVTCACGISICFACFGDAHWPARCDQADIYSDRLDSITVPDEADVDPSEKKPALPSAPKQKYKNKPVVMKIEGRLCPGCHSFIEKNGGCPYMVCKCKLSFCWKCLSPWGFNHFCNPNHRRVEENSREVIVKHVNRQAQPLGDTANSQATPDNTEKVSRGRTRVNLYQRAKQQRSEGDHQQSSKSIDALALRIATVASKDKEFRNEIMRLCNNNHSHQQQQSPPGDMTSLKSHVSKFLSSCEQSRRSLHHVTEFTFVLLQDTRSGAQSVDRRRALALANDIAGYCSFSRSILEGGGEHHSQQQVREVVRRLVNIQAWARRALGTLVKTVNKLKKAGQ